MEFWNVLELLQTDLRNLKNMWGCQINTQLLEKCGAEVLGENAQSLWPFLSLDLSGPRLRGAKPAEPM